MKHVLGVMLRLFTSSEWHDYWKGQVGVEQREQPRGAHIADVVAVDGCVVEVQHDSMSPTKIRGRELDHGHMVWIWDVREAYASGQLQITGFSGGFVTFRWKNHRRNIRSCRRPCFLDLGEMHGTNVRVLLRIQQIHADGTGTGHLISHHSMRLWLTVGIPCRPLPELPDYGALDDGP